MNKKQNIENPKIENIPEQVADQVSGGATLDQYLGLARNFANRFEPNYGPNFPAYSSPYAPDATTEEQP